MPRGFPLRPGVDGQARESASSRDFPAAGWVVTWALGFLSPPPPPSRVFKRKEKLLVESFVIFAVSLAARPVETHFASLPLGSWTRRGCENRRWKLAGWRGGGGSRPERDPPPTHQPPPPRPGLRQASGLRGKGWRSRSGLREVGSLSAAGGPERARCASRYSGKGTCPHFRDR